jgi:hypothetical protein
MFFLIFIPTSIALWLMLVHLRKMKKHDRVLFRFCQIRRDIIVIMREPGFNPSKSDYRILRVLLDGANATIHEYNSCKIKLFNFRNFIALAKEYQRNAQKVDKLSTSNPAINEIKEKYKRAMILAFLSYTPLIKSQIAFQITSGIILAIFGLMINLGLKSLGIEKSFDYLSWLNKEIKEYPKHTLQHAA